jgi:uncharacterized damage-inducible protein DinB
MTTQTQTFDTKSLLPWLVAQQRRVLGILDGLEDQGLRKVVLPSWWSCAGMVQHLTLMTRFWLVEVMTGVRDDTHMEDEFRIDDTYPASTILETYKEQSQMAIALVRDLPLHTPPVWWPDDLFGDWRLDNLFEILLHVLIETTCHAGHLDAARELIDGRTWDYALGRLREP